MAADVTAADGLPRFVWTDAKPDPITYTRVLLASIAERHRWRAQYQAAKTAERGCGWSFGNRPAALTLRQAQGDASATTLSASPTTSQVLVSGLAVKGERSESAGHEVPLTARAETTPSPVGEAEHPDHRERVTGS